MWVIAFVVYQFRIKYSLFRCCVMYPVMTFMCLVTHTTHTENGNTGMVPIIAMSFLCARIY